MKTSAEARVPACPESGANFVAAHGGMILHCPTFPDEILDAREEKAESGKLKKESPMKRGRRRPKTPAAASKTARGEGTHSQRKRRPPYVPLLK